MKKAITVRFYAASSGHEPVKQWLIDDINNTDRKTIGQDLQTVEYGWPMGMPIVCKMARNLWEVHSNISNGRIARVFFTVTVKDLILLHGFVKKSQTTPKQDLNLAKRRRDEVLR